VAATNRKKDLVKQLLKKKASIDEQEDKTGQTALHMAVISRHLDIVKLLLKYGANVNQKEKVNHNTALHIAASLGDTKIVQSIVGEDNSITKVNIEEENKVNIVKTWYKGTATINAFSLRDKMKISRSDSELKTSNQASQESTSDLAPVASLENEDFLKNTSISRLPESINDNLHNLLSKNIRKRLKIPSSTKEVVSVILQRFNKCGGIRVQLPRNNGGTIEFGLGKTKSYSR